MQPPAAHPCIHTYTQHAKRSMLGRDGLCQIDGDVPLAHFLSPTSFENIVKHRPSPSLITFCAFFLYHLLVSILHSQSSTLLVDHSLLMVKGCNLCLIVWTVINAWQGSTMTEGDFLCVPGLYTGQQEVKASIIVAFANIVVCSSSSCGQLFGLWSVQPTVLQCLFSSSYNDLCFYCVLYNDSNCADMYISR